MEVKASLRKAFRESEDEEVGVRLTGSGPVSFEFVSDMIERAFPADGDVPMLAELAAMPLSATGAGLWVSGCAVGDFPELLDRLGRAASELGRDDLVASTLSAVSTLGPYGPLDFLRVYFAVRGRRPDDWDGPLGWPLERARWEVSDQDRASCSDELLSWFMAQAPADARFAIAKRVSNEIGREAVRGIGRRVVGIPMYWPTFEWFTKDTFANVSFALDEGLASVAIGRRSKASAFDWRQTLSDLITLTKICGPWVDYLHIARDSNYLATTAFAPANGSNLPPLYINMADLARESLGHGVLFDAQGVYGGRLPQLALAESSGLWHRTDDHPNLLTHVDLTAWFSEPTVEPTTLQTARAALQPLLPPPGTIMIG